MVTWYIWWCWVWFIPFVITSLKRVLILGSSVVNMMLQSRETCLSDFWSPHKLWRCRPNLSGQIFLPGRPLVHKQYFKPWLSVLLLLIVFSILTTQSAVSMVYDLLVTTSCVVINTTSYSWWWKCAICYYLCLSVWLLYHPSNCTSEKTWMIFKRSRCCICKCSNRRSIN